MRSIIMTAALLLAGIPAMPAMAQSMVWSGANLVFVMGASAGVSGCKLSLVAANASDSRASTASRTITITLRNDTGRLVQVGGAVNVSGNGQNLTVNFSDNFGGGATVQRGPLPVNIGPGASLVGTTLRVSIRSWS